MNNNDHSQQVHHESKLHANSKGSLFLLCKAKKALTQVFRFMQQFFFLALLMISNTFIKFRWLFLFRFMIYHHLIDIIN